MALSWPALAMLLIPAPLMTRRNPMNLHVATIDGAVINQLPPPLPIAGKLASKPKLSARDAARAFAEMMADEWEGERFTFPHIIAAFDDLAPLHNWPTVASKEVSPKAISMALKRIGCKSETGPRLKNGTRPSIVTFAKKKRRRKPQ